MTAPTPLVEKVAKAIRSASNGIDGDSIAALLDESPLIEMATNTREEADELILRVCASAARAALDACHVEELVRALRAAHAHAIELRKAWERGAISEHDGLGSTRSNRNVDVEVTLRALLAKLDGQP